MIEHLKEVTVPTTQLSPAPGPVVVPTPKGRCGQPWPQIVGRKIRKKLGHGGMGVVYLAEDLNLGRKTAIKVLPEINEGSDEVLARFLREGRAIARLDHHNILKIYNLDFFQGHPYLELEYAAGGSLQEKLSAGALPFFEAAQLVRDIAAAVQHAHDRNVLHRDIKPANVLLMEDGMPKLGDFGLAKLIDDGTLWTQPGAILGTPNYMAPEQIEDRPLGIGPWTDVWGLGALFFALLSKHPPFKGKSIYEVWAQVCATTPIPALPPEVPPELEAICLGCLKRDAAERPSALALAEDLGRFL